MRKRILRLTNLEAVLKFDGPVGSQTIFLDTDLLLPTEELIVATPRAAAIAQFITTGSGSGTINITRNGETLWTLLPTTASSVNLLDFGGVVDTTHSTHNIVITSAGAEMQMIIKLRKTAGYRTRIRIAETARDTPV